ncbi:polysaccharide pyruvyl transferase family protein [Microbacterium sp. p3-SID338]|uniref:polysaccharide pyruvyl transferase family protein n=1 Tax=unclassified Microbacterium TaxID=2609290 RepID=UPI000A70010E|nr:MULTISPECIES: polysaccharide pyruvyl transferase family protein [unclassified Microbacterium]MCT1395296.1 polysaccharide pyruvyl transferase family protein [Microbacterium sp. p3-SID338]
MPSLPVRAARTIRRMGEQVFRAPQAPLYLVSAGGQPNFGDEFITRSWLDWLAEHQPYREVWLDTIEPGRAAHLFRDTHPRLKTTNTLWHATHTGPADDHEAAASRMRGLIRELGSPRYDLGLRDLRGMASIHLLGGGYMNSIWPENFGIIEALVTLKAEWGIRLFATGQGLLPHEGETREWLRARLQHFDYVEARDEASAQAFGVVQGLDDAFLAFANDRPIYAPPEGLPDTMVLVQGDMADPDTDERLDRLVTRFMAARTDPLAVGFAEGIPPEDHRRAAPFVADGSPFFPFLRIWDEGFPAREGQEWLTTRFHFHLLAAAAGARGTVVNARPGYYDIKHASLQELGTGWASSDLGDGGTPESEALPTPTGDPDFPARAQEFGLRKAELAAHLYLR